MAGRNSCRRKEMLGRTCNVVFEGGLSSTTRSSLVCEFLKHVIFQRNQIPLPVDHLKRDLKRLEIESGKDHIAGKKAGLNRTEHRKTKEAMYAVDKLIEHVQSAFHFCPDIRQLLIILGGSPVSPKEMYLVTFPAYYPDIQPLSSKVAVKSLFRQLIASDFVNAPKPLSTTNTILLLNAPRDSPLSSFHSKCRYKPPNRGALYQMEWSCVQDDDCDMEVSVIEESGNISGIQPLNFSNVNMSVGECDCASSTQQGTENNQITDTFSCGLCVPETVTELTPLMDDEGIHSLSDEEYIWFQAPVVIKGFKDRTSKKIE